MLQIRPRYALPVAIFSALLLILSIPSGVSLQINSISSQGIINYTGDEPWWGVCIGDTFWPPCGSYFTDTQIDMIRNANGTCIRLLIEYKAWDENLTDNILGISYRDYLKQLVEWCHPDIKVFTELTNDANYENWNAETKVEIIRDDAKRQKWIAWGVEVVEYCNPDGIGLMDEPCGAGSMDSLNFTPEEYRTTFVVPFIEALRTVDSDVKIFVQGNPWHYFDMFFPEGEEHGGITGAGLLPYDNVVYLMSYPYYSGNDVGWESLYYGGDLAAARNALHRMLDGKVGGIVSQGGEIHLTASVYRADLPNWTAFLKDTYDWMKDNNIGFTQYGLTKGTNWRLVESNYVEWNNIGQFWAENVP
ncbi:MAG: hypothetical protein ACFE7A_05940 [Promethearchaeota archaeon]